MSFHDFADIVVFRFRFSSFEGKIKGHECYAVVCDYNH